MSIVIRYCPQGLMRICLHFAGFTHKKRATRKKSNRRGPCRSPLSFGNKRVNWGHILDCLGDLERQKQNYAAASEDFERAVEQAEGCYRVSEEAADVFEVTPIHFWAERDCRQGKARRE
jgi:hypothetical protein